MGRKNKYRGRRGREWAANKKKKGKPISGRTPKQRETERELQIRLKQEGVTNPELIDALIAERDEEEQLDQASRAKLSDAQVDFFHRSYAVVVVTNQTPQISVMQRIWMERYGTELTRGRFGYYAYDPREESNRIAAIKGLANDIAYQAKTSPTAWMHTLFNAFLETHRRCSEIVVKRVVINRVKDEEGEWKDSEHVIPGMLDAKGATESMKELRALLEANAVLCGQAIPGDFTGGKKTYNVDGRQNIMTRTFNQLNTGMLDEEGAAPAKIGKAPPIRGEGNGGLEDVEAPVVTQAQAKILVAGENDPFGIPPDDSVSYGDHLKLIKEWDRTGKPPKAIEGVVMPKEGDGQAAADALAEKEKVEAQRNILVDPEAAEEADDAKSRLQGDENLEARHERLEKASNGD